MTAPHPLEPLSAEELARTAKLILADGRVGRRPQFAWIALAEAGTRTRAAGGVGGRRHFAWIAGAEPDRAPVRAGRPVARRGGAVVVARHDGVSYEVVADLRAGDVERPTALDGLHGGFVFE